jgi:hypothetical protein
MSEFPQVESPTGLNEPGDENPMRFKLMTLFLLAEMAWSTDQVIGTLSSPFF